MNKEISKRKAAYTAYITSEEWYNIKLDLIQIRGNKCEKCGKKKPIKFLHIHHLTYDNLFNEEPEDLLILCAMCHMKEHGLIKIKTKKSKKKKEKKIKKNKHLSGFKTYKTFSEAVRIGKMRAKTYIIKK